MGYGEGGFVARLGEQAGRTGWQLVNAATDVVSDLLNDLNLNKNLAGWRIIYATHEQQNTLMARIADYNRGVNPDQRILFTQLAGETAGPGKFDNGEMVEIPVVFKKHPASTQAFLERLVRSVGATMSFGDRPLVVG